MKKFSSLLVVSLLMLASFTAGVEYQRGDVSQDGHVDIADVTCLINYLLHGTWDDEPLTPPDDHEWVDLGLPSGTLWATCNIGASTPEGAGDRFAWGETASKEFYDWTNYKWCNGSMYTLTKYCTDSSFGIVDDKTELDPEDDAAYINWSPSWRIPTFEQMQELINNCTSEWTTMNGVNGYQVIGPNGYSLFLPVTRGLNEARYWTSTLSSGESRNALNIYFYSTEKPSGDVDDRAYGFNIRAVRVQQD